MSEGFLKELPQISKGFALDVMIEIELMDRLKRLKQVHRRTPIGNRTLIYLFIYLYIYIYLY